MLKSSALKTTERVNMIRRVLASLLCLGASWLQADESSVGGSIQPAHRWIQAGPAKVDAVSGQIELSLPIGPTLPGRIPVGFGWHTEGLGGSIDAYGWPNWKAAHEGARLVITVGHQKITFLPGMPTDATNSALKWMQDRGLSSGQEKVTNLGEGYTSYHGSSIFTSEDGLSHLVTSAWYIKAPVPPKPWTPETVWPPEDPRVFSARMAIIQGDTIIWTSFEDDTAQNVQQTPRPFTEIRNRWGDWVRVDKVFDSVTGVMVGGTMTSSLGHTLTLSGSGSLYTLTNSMGLATVQITAIDEIFRGIAPTAISTSGLSGNDWTITWYTQGARLESIQSRGGPRVDYQWGGENVNSVDGVATPTNEAFDEFGIWKGYEPVTYVNSGTVLMGEIRAGIKAVKSTSTVSGETGGSLIEFVRTFPKPASYDPTNKTIVWTTRKYQTEIRLHSQPTPGTNYRFVRLIHAEPKDVYGALDQPEADQRQMVLFTFSAVVQEIRGTVSGGEEVIRTKTTYDGWGLRGPMNPSGIIAGSLALDPVATRVVVERPQGEGPTLVTEQSGWNGRMFQTYRQVIKPGAMTAYDGTGKPAGAAWRSVELPEADAAMGGIQRVTTQGTAWNSDLVQLQRSTTNTTLAGSDHMALRGVASADFGEKRYQYDGFGRVSLVTGITGNYTSELEQIPVPGQPEIQSTTRRITGPEGAVALSGRMGEDFSYNGPWRVGSRQRPDTRWSTEERDTLGRLKATVTENGVRTSIHYDEFGRAWKSVREAKGVVASSTFWKEWDPTGRWVREHAQGHDGSDLVKETQYDGFGRAVAIVSAKGTPAERTVYMKYDGFGQRIQESLPTKPGGTARYSTTVYDLDGFVLSKSNSRGVVIATFGRPVQGELDGESGFLSLNSIRRVVGGYEQLTGEQILKDELGQTIVISDGLDQVTRLSYDAFGRLREVKKGAQVRSYTYNEMGWLLNKTQPEEGATIYERHTMLGQALKVTKGSGESSTTITTDLYPAGDPNEGLTSTVNAAGLGSSLVTTLGYDTQRRLGIRVDTQANGTVTEKYKYDDLSRLNEKEVGDGTVTFTVRQDLDAFGKVVRLHYPSLVGQSGRAVARSYDALHRPSSIAYGPTNAEANLGTMAHDQIINSEEAELLSYANGASTSWQRNLDQELSRVIHSAGGVKVEDAAISWANGGILVGRGADRFDYDALGRLSNAKVYGLNGECVNQNFSYDAQGNRISVTSSALAGVLPAEAVSYRLNVGVDNRLPASTETGVSTGVQYDAQGRMRQIWAVPGDASTMTSWSYDAAGRVVSQGGAQLSYAESYLLDGLGLRFKRVLSNGTIQYRVYGFNGEPLSTFEKLSASQSMSGGALATLTESRGTSRTNSSTSARSGSAGVTAVVNPGDDPCYATAAIVQPSGPITVGVGQNVSFMGGGDGTTFSWTFGDGGTANVQNTSHAFGSVGTYSTRLTVRKSGCLPASAAVMVTVVQGPSIGAFSATPVSIYRGQSSTLAWSVTPAGAGTTTVSLDQGLGVQQGTWLSVNPNSTRTYTLTASSSYGTATRSVTVAVSEPPPPPAISSFTTSSGNLIAGQSALLAWNVSGADSLTLNGSVVTGTSVSVWPTANTTYTLVARNSFGQDQRSLSITVSTPEPQLAWVSDAVYGWGQLIFEKRGSVGIYQQGDHLGSPAVLTNEGGVVVGRQKSLPFGERLNSSGNKSLRRFTNHEDGMQLPVYMQARMYLPTYGRFSQVDLGYDYSSDGLNLYSYVSNQPITQSDPNGMREVGGGGGSNPSDHLPLHLKNDPNDLGGWIWFWEDLMSLSGGSTSYDGAIRMANPFGIWSSLPTASESTADQSSQSGVESKNALTATEKPSLTVLWLRFGDWDQDTIDSLRDLGTKSGVRLIEITSQEQFDAVARTAGKNVLIQAHIIENRTADGKSVYSFLGPSNDKSFNMPSQWSSTTKNILINACNPSRSDQISSVSRELANQGIHVYYNSSNQVQLNFIPSHLSYPSVPIYGNNVFREAASWYIKSPDREKLGLVPWTEFK